MSKIVIDARGLSCPEPVLLAQKALKQHADNPFTVLVSSPTARDNVAAFLTKNGKSVCVEEKDDEWAIDVK